MTTNNLLVTINNRIGVIAATERTVKAELGIISRELLLYVPESKDIDAVNRLIAVLTPMNKQTAVLFFSAFLPWAYDAENKRFAGMIKGAKAIEAKLASLADFLSSEENTIWLWAERNVKVETKKVPFDQRLTALVGKALAGEKGVEPISKEDVIKAVIAGGVSAGDLINMIEQAKVAFAARQVEENKAAALPE